MTIKLLLGDEIRSHVLKILSGECVFKRRPQWPSLYILSPWISDVTIDFSDRFVSKEKNKYRTGEKIDSFLLEDYNIKSINLSYALLLFKLHGACESYQNVPNINIVTLPPNENNYSHDYVPKVKNLLNFLDEIGCHIFLNSNLHSKVLVTNDLALLGSFNLSSSALLYNREEIGVSINDLDNLERLEAYCRKVMRESTRFGYSSRIDYGENLKNGEAAQVWTLEELISSTKERPLFEKDKISRKWKGALRLFHPIYKSEEVSLSESQITRGWLLDMLINSVYWTGGYGEFLNITGGYDRFISFYARDLDNFYRMSIKKIVSSQDGIISIFSNFDYDGDEDVDSIMKFLDSKLARRTVPFVKLQLKSLDS